MPIKLERVVELIEQHDKNPKNLRNNYYVTHMKIILENEGVGLEEWDNLYTEGMREEAFKKVEPIIEQAIRYKS